MTIVSAVFMFIAMRLNQASKFAVYNSTSLLTSDMTDMIVYDSILKTIGIATFVVVVTFFMAFGEKVYKIIKKEIDKKNK